MVKSKNHRRDCAYHQGCVDMDGKEVSTWSFGGLTFLLDVDVTSRESHITVFQPDTMRHTRKPRGSK